MKIVFIGAGNMAEALVAGIVKEKVSTPDKVCVADISQERLDHFSASYGVMTSADNPSAVADADVVVLSVKPQIFPVVWPELEAALRSDALVVSVMAGVTTAGIQGGRAIRVVRVMPNTPALIGEGAAGIAAGSHATEADLKVAETLMKAVGAAVIVKEAEIDAVTALSGSGPAYVFYLLEGMLAAAEKMGMGSETARQLALATVEGAAKLMKKTGEDAGELRRKVTSKGGTTEAALNTMEERGVKDSIVAALIAARDRSQELANG